MFIASKINQPQNLQSLVSRPRLAAALQHTDATKLILVCGPAGYSKTSTIMQWSNQQPNLAWYALDKFDDDPYRFASYLIQTIYNSSQQACEKTLQMLQQRSFANLTTLITQLLDEIGQSQVPLTLVLDDYHCITQPEIHQAMKLLIKYMPTNWKVAITSRNRPPLSLSSLRLKQQLIEIHPEMLAFDLKEVTAFFALRLNFEVSSQSLRDLKNKVEGWPSALQLVALTAKNPEHFLQCAEQIAKSQHAHLWDYLEDEVFAPLTDDEQQLLLDIAPLKQVDAEMVNHLTGRNDGQQVLEKMETDGLFLVARDVQKQWFSFHALFKGFLLHEKAKCPQRQHDDLKIAKIWLQRDMPIYALPHVLYTQDKQLVTDLLLQAGWLIFHEGEVSGLDLCFDLLGDAFLNHPQLVLLKAWMYQVRHQNDQVQPLLTQARNWFQRHKITIPAELSAKFEALEAQVAISQGKVDDALLKANRAMAQLNEGDSHTRLAAQSVIGEAFHCQGQLAAAYKQQENVRQSALRHQQYQTAAWAMYQQVEILYAQAEKDAAEQLLGQLEQLIKSHHLDQLPLYTFALHFKALLAYQHYQFEQAQALSEQALEVASAYGDKWLLFCYSLQAKIALERGDDSASHQLIERIEHLLHNKQYHSDWVANANYARIKYWRSKGDHCALAQWLASAPEPASAFNRFDQCHWRNRIRAMMQLGQLSQAQSLCREIIKDARRCQLHVDINRNHILLASICVQMGDKDAAKASVITALEASLFTGLTTCFIRHGQPLLPLMDELQQQPSVTKAVKHKISELLDLAQYQAKEDLITPFEANKVSEILDHPQVPSLVKNIPLTSREWQVLGFIHHGYTNDKISKTMDVAPTTVKSHIRNLYQKLGLSGREEAINLSNQLLSLAY
ncbi:HTH-type transcriptional regulator MalT [Motilimonas pumila]|nr:HTH-type transcriptional regulator MalT [Motilimonas pumila]